MPWDDDTIRDFASQFVRDEVFGSDNDLFTEFDTDAFTLLVRTECGF
jgi:hypothetical protein